MSNENHALFDPVAENSEWMLDARRRHTLVSVRAGLWRALLDHGKEYVGIERPKGYRRQRRIKDCFRNATEIALKGNGATYVEGVAWDMGCGFHHAWIRLDDEHAIDQTWPTPGTRYLGIAVPLKELCHVLSRTGYYGSIIEKMHANTLLQVAA
jgi:hypothetical protein